MNDNYQKNWEEFCSQELIKATLLLEQLGFSLNKQQIHISGERYLTGNSKLVLLGIRNNDQKPVVIKFSSDPQMIAEIEDERRSRQILKEINFAYHIFALPPEILYTHKQDCVIFITEFIEQEMTFLERPLTEQFFIALKAFEAQEAIHSTTYEHANIIKKVFGIFSAETYLEKADRYIREIDLILKDDQNLKNILTKAFRVIEDNLETIDIYSNFLTHWDFVPHNFRVRGNELYLLDHAALRFGNKYESWARFINFMVLYNDQLAQLLLEYVKNNRDQSEYLALKLMRIFRLIEIIWYYAKTLDKAGGDLNVLNQKRIIFWTKVLDSVLADQPIDRNTVEEYKRIRDSLRSPEEKERQKKLH